MVKDGVEWDNDRPLARAKGELQRHTQALNDYYDLGPKRSHASLIEKYLQYPSSENAPPTTKLNTISKWSIMYDWQARIARQEEIKNELDQIELARKEQEERELWAKRRAEYYHRTYETAADLQEAAAQMLTMLKKWKISETKTEEPDGTKVIVRTIKPDVSISQLATALDTSEDLLAKVLEIPDRAERQEVTGKGGAPLFNDTEIIVIEHE